MIDESSREPMTHLVNAINSFLEWQKEMDLVREMEGKGAGEDAAAVLMRELNIPSDNVRVLIGGSNCPIFAMAVNEIRRLRSQLEEAERERLSVNECRAITRDWDETNHRRGELIHRKHSRSGATDEELAELAELQRLAEMRQNIIDPLVFPRLPAAPQSGDGERD